VSTATLWRRRPEDAASEVIARIVARTLGRPAVIEPLAGFTEEGIRAILAGGAIGADGRTLHLEDGAAFVEALPGTLRGTRLWAELDD